MNWILAHFWKNNRNENGAISHANHDEVKVVQHSENGMFKTMEIVDKQIGNAVTRLSDR